MRRKIFFVSLLALLLNTLCSIEVHANLCDLSTYVFYGNGMFNSQYDAGRSLVELDDRLRAAGDLPNDGWKFELSYNHDEKIYSLFEVFRQRMGDKAASYWRWLGSLAIAPDWFQDAAEDLANRFDQAEALVDADLRRHVQRYQNLLMGGNRVLVVAHSQGNLYANAAYGNLAGDDRIPIDAFGLVSVATPASRVAGGGPYYTLMYDLVISAVQLAVPGTLPGNVTNTVSDSDWKHHSFIDSYLNGDQTGPLIVSSALSKANELSWPEPQVGTGPISVTLTWGSQPDLDLHVFEPDGSHVFYKQPLGTSGYLDQDDTRYWGPEHYFVEDCEFLDTGIYRVAVNYFYGSAPQTAQVQVQAGNLIRNYSLNLPHSRGIYGDFSPDPVAKIEVIGSPDGGYEFNVEGLD